MSRLTYKKTGVDIEKGDLISKTAFNQLKKTLNSDSHIFKNLIGLKANFEDYQDPYLALSADGVGTKLVYTFRFGQPRFAGIDAVAMCVNDLARNNIKPLGFALYRATGQIDEKVMFEVAEGVSRACLESDCVYVTGESAEMPDFYQPGEFDLAGFATGVFDKDKLITGENIKAGDAVIGLVSSGLHSNGFSLVRRIFPPTTVQPGSTLQGQLTLPTRIYVKSVLAANEKFKIKAWAHITGGGLFGKLGKVLPKNLKIELLRNSWPISDIFQELQKKGGVTEPEMYSTFNMGLGFVGIIDSKNADKLLRFLEKSGEEAFIVGQVSKASSTEKVRLTK